MRRTRVSKFVATGVSVSATFAGVGLIAHADATPGEETSGDDGTAGGSLDAAVQVPVAPNDHSATSDSATSDTTTSDTTTTIGPNSLLDVPGPPMLPTKSTEPALAVPVPTFVDSTIDGATAPAAAEPAAAASTAPRAPSAAPAPTPASAPTSAPDPAPTMAPADTTPTATPPAPPPAPETTAPPPPPPTLPVLTAPPDDTSRGTS